MSARGSRRWRTSMWRRRAKRCRCGRRRDGPRRSPSSASARPRRRGPPCRPPWPLCIVCSASTRGAGAGQRPAAPPPSGPPCPPPSASSWAAHGDETEGAGQSVRERRRVPGPGRGRLPRAPGPSAASVLRTCRRNILGQTLAGIAKMPVPLAGAGELRLNQRPSLRARTSSQRTRGRQNEAHRARARRRHGRRRVPERERQRCNQGRPEKGCRPGAPRERQPPPSQTHKGHPRAPGNTHTRREGTPVRDTQTRRPKPPKPRRRARATAPAALLMNAPASRTGRRPTVPEEPAPSPRLMWIRPRATSTGRRTR